MIWARKIFIQHKRFCNGQAINNKLTKLITIMTKTKSIIETQRPSVTALCNEYTDWLVANIDKEYIENQCCPADSLLWDSVDLGLNNDQKTWLRKFITRWEKAYL